MVSATMCVSSGLLGGSLVVTAQLVSPCTPPPGPVDSSVLHMSVIHCLSVNDIAMIRAYKGSPASSIRLMKIHHKQITYFKNKTSQRI